MAKETYEFDFSYDDGKWSLTNALIIGGVLYVAVIPWSGSGRRVPDANWGCRANDDFEIEVKFRRKMIDVEPSINSWWTITISLIDDTSIDFIHETTIEKLSIYVDGYEKVFTYQNMNDTNWHIIKIKRIGTVYYLSVDNKPEINYDYGILKALKGITLAYKHSLPHENSNGGEYDDFKYSWWKTIDQDYAFIM